MQAEIVSAKNSNGTLPGKPQALVSLTFDDALPEHLDVAMPILERHGMRGTFYVNVGSESFLGRQDEWAAAAARGHELGNHTVFHPGVSSKPWVTPGIALDTYSLDRMRLELEVANRVLTATDGQVERSFAFPCSNPWLGKPGWPRRTLERLGLHRTRIMGFVDRHGLDWGSQRVDYTSIVRQLFVAARCGGIEAGLLPTMPLDWHQIRGIEGDGKTQADLLESLETAVARGAWINFVFHGVGGGHHMSVDSTIFDGFLRCLALDERVAVDTFIGTVRALRRSGTSTQ